MNQANAARVLRSLRAENTELASHLQALRDENPAVRNLDLSSYLLVPSTFAAVFLPQTLILAVQRVTRYPLLIKQVSFSFGV